MPANIFDQIKNAEAAKRKALAELHTALGFASARALAQAILEAAGASSSMARATGVAAASPARQGSKKGKRLTPETRQQIAAALKSGEPAARIAKHFGVSYPTVHKLKSSLGLVTSRGKRGKR